MKPEKVFQNLIFRRTNTMRKSKVLGIALAAAMVTSIAATAAIGASAKVSKDGIDGETVGITGSFCNWGNGGEADIPMTNNNGVWEGTIQIDNVTDDMLGDAMKDDGTGAKVLRDDIQGKAITFKVRTNGDWTNSWGDYEPDYDRTNNSQTDCAVAAEAGKPLTIKVKLDTTTVVAGSSIPADDGDAWMVWPVTYEVVASEATVEESKAEESKAEESKAEKSKAEESKAEKSKTVESKPAQEKKEDTAPVQTGDTASAAALVAVVLASLGTAVVMTKKASAKD